MSRRTSYTCPDCGGPMDAVTSGGEEPDGKGGWQRATSQQFRCRQAWADYSRRRLELRDQLEKECGEHVSVVRLPWPPKDSEHERRVEQLAFEATMAELAKVDGGRDQ